MKKIYSIVFCLVFILSFFQGKIQAIEYSGIDSIYRERIIEIGRHKLTAVIAKNEENIKKGHTEQLQFVINISPEDYVIDRAISNKPHYLSSEQAETSLNSRLNQVANTYGISCYFILISYLDVKFTAAIPDQYTLNELFNTGKFFQENSNIMTMEKYHFDITSNIINNITSATKNFMVFSMAKYCASEFHNTTGCHHLYKTDTVRVSGSPEIPNFKNTFTYFRTHLKNNIDLLTAPLNDDRVDKAVSSLESAAKNAPLKAQILNLYLPYNLTSIFSQFTSSDYYTLSIAERLHCLSVFAGYTMSGDGITMFSTNEEGYALKILRYTEQKDLVPLYEGLAQVSTLKNNPNYNGEKDDKALIVKLINKINDGIGGDNYGKLISIILNHFNGCAPLLDNYLSIQDTEIKEIKYYSTDVIPTASEAGTINYNVNLKDNGELDVEREVAYTEVNLAGDCIDIGNGCLTTHWETLDPINNLKPFSIILFSNYSKLSLVEDLTTGEDNPLIAPAVVLKYCDDKDFNNVTVKRLSLALDAVTVFTGAAAVKQAINAHRYAMALYEAAQILSAGGNIVVNLTNDPQIDALKQEYDNIMLVWDMANIINGTGKIISKAYHSVKNGTAKRITKEAAQGFITRYEQLKTSGKQLPANFKKLYIYLKSKIGSVVGGAGDLLTKRTNWLNSLKSQYGIFDITNFKPQGLNAVDVPGTTYSEMLGEYSTAIDNLTKQRYLNGLIKSGSTVPIKKTFSVGDELYKIVPKGEGVTPYTPFFMTKEEFEAIEMTTNIEQKLGLPLISHAVEYDVYKITATQHAKAFENTIANTLEKTYTTTGGAKQMLVIDRSKWSSAVKVKTIIPN